MQGQKGTAPAVTQPGTWLPLHSQSLLSCFGGVVAVSPLDTVPEKKTAPQPEQPLLSRDRQSPELLRAALSFPLNGQLNLTHS